MSNNYIASGDDLTLVANAIRIKGGTSDYLEFPTEFVSAINAISTGSSGSVTQDTNGYIVLPSTNGGSGGGSNWTLLATQEYTVSTAVTTNTSVGDITLTLSDYNDPQTVLWVHIRDKAGKRIGYFYGSDTIFFHYQLADESTVSLSVKPVVIFSADSNGKYSENIVSSGYGIFAYRLYYSESNHYLQIYSRYNSLYGTIDGTFKVDVYKLTMPSGMTLFEVEEEE